MFKLGLILAALLRISQCSAQAPLPRDGWTASADSSESQREDTPASNVLDGSTASIWHTQWSNKHPPPLPHQITIEFGPGQTGADAITVSGLQYTPRQDGNNGFINGNIGKYEVYVSVDGADFGEPVAAGTWDDTAEMKEVEFAPVQASMIRLTALSEAGGRGPWTSAAEIGVLGSGSEPCGDEVQSQLRTRMSACTEAFAARALMHLAARVAVGLTVAAASLRNIAYGRLCLRCTRGLVQGSMCCTSGAPCNEVPGQNITCQDTGAGVEADPTDPGASCNECGTVVRTDVGVAP